VRAALLAATCLMGLAGCQTWSSRNGPASAMPQAAINGRVIASGALNAWTMQGRIAVSDGSDGGSGRLEWRQDGPRFDVQLSAPVTRRSWRLVGDASWVRLEGLDEGAVEGPDATQLLRQSVGWELPVESLVDWMKGVPSRGAFDGDWDEQGLPRRIVQCDWVIEYRDWFHDLTPPLPRKVFAQSGKHRVRLVVERWDVTP